jgi:hypothetical protein
MPIYDCGEPECAECQRAFGPDRTAAVARFKAREAAYAKLSNVADGGGKRVASFVVGGV